MALKNLPPDKFVILFHSRRSLGWYHDATLRVRLEASAQTGKGPIPEGHIQIPSARIIDASVLHGCGGVERALHLPRDTLDGAMADADFVGNFQNTLASP